jgi:dTDP-glucose 4,6-dehydratase
MSSGAVYGQQPWDLAHVGESWCGAPNSTDPRATYAEAKRAAEMLCAIFKKQFGLEVVISRIFALLGPYLSLDIHFAAGNFIRDAIAGRRIVIRGNGRPCRSYLYASDLAVWLLHMLVRAESGRAYNVGSDQSISIQELAELISDSLGGVGVDVLDMADLGWNLGRYVPDTSAIQSALGLSRTVALKDAIMRTAIWNGWDGAKK